MREESGTSEVPVDKNAFSLYNVFTSHRGNLKSYLKTSFGV